MTKYAEWIAANVKDTRGTCREVTARMAAAFPELTRVRGHYYCWVWGERAHWWLTTPDDRIIDPTAAQFPSKGNGEYVPWLEGQPEPTGRCANCGNDCFNGDTCCTEFCSNLLLESLR